MRFPDWEIRHPAIAMQQTERTEICAIKNGAAQAVLVIGTEPQRLQIPLIDSALAPLNVSEQFGEGRTYMLLRRTFRDSLFRVAATARELSVGDDLIPINRPRER